MLKEFKEFALKGNVVDLAIALVIGAAFGAIVNSLVKDIIMPPIGWLLGDVDFANMLVVLSEGDPVGPYATPAAAAEAGAVTWNYGVFVNTIITFIIVALAMFVVVKLINKARRAQEAEAETKDCPYCLSAIPIPATRCPQCTSALSGD